MLTYRASGGLVTFCPRQITPEFEERTELGESILQ
jgi:hypothetical protein